MTQQGTGSSSGRDERPHPGRTPAGSVVGRFAGGVATLMLLGTAVTGFTISARTARSYRAVRAQTAGLLRAPLLQRLRANAHELSARVTAAEVADDWSSLQSELPRRARIDPELLSLQVTDEEGLVLAHADPLKNGLPVSGEALRALLRRAEPGASELTVEGRPGVLVLERLTTAEGRVRIVALIGSIAAERAVDAALAAEARAEQRVGWLFVALGGFLCAAVAVGAVVVVGGSIARRLHIVAWRISELGRDDRGTHVRLGGPAELEHVELELERAAQRLSALASAEAARRDAEATRQAVRSVVERGDQGEHRFGPLLIRCARAETATSACTLAVRPRADGGVTIVFVEVLGSTLSDALLATELRSASLALAGDAALGPAPLLGRLDGGLGSDRRARAMAVQITPTGTLRVASAGARFPVHVQGVDSTPLVVRGDRLGEPGAHRGDELSLTLRSGEVLELSGEAPHDALAEGELGLRPALTVTISLESAA